MYNLNNNLKDININKIMRLGSPKTYNTFGYHNILNMGYTLNQSSIIKSNSNDDNDTLLLENHYTINKIKALKSLFGNFNNISKADYVNNNDIVLSKKKYINGFRYKKKLKIFERYNTNFKKYIKMGSFFQSDNTIFEIGNLKFRNFFELICFLKSKKYNKMVDILIQSQNTKINYIDKNYNNNELNILGTLIYDIDSTDELIDNTNNNIFYENNN